MREEESERGERSAKWIVSKNKIIKRKYGKMEVQN
jgi:hypothetical protein